MTTSPIKFDSIPRRDSITAFIFAYFTAAGERTEPRVIYSSFSPERAIKAFWNRNRKSMAFVAYGFDGQTITGDTNSRRIDIRKRGNRNARPTWAKAYTTGAYTWVEPSDVE